MTVFETGSTGIGSDHSVNYDTTTALYRMTVRNHLIICTFRQNALCKYGLQMGV